MLSSANTVATGILDFLGQLDKEIKLPRGTGLLNPYTDPAAWAYVEAFYRKYYGDQGSRIFIFGINPGRLGGGLTGIPFTDPVRLQDVCGIANPLKKIPELSSRFIYTLIEAWGGPGLFYSRFYISSVCPLGFLRGGKNLNYYDDKKLQAAVEPFIRESIQKQLELIPHARTCFCLGEGINYQYFTGLNEELGFFEKIIPLPHPRWIMQYRLKALQEWVQHYIHQLRTVVAE